MDADYQVMQGWEGEVVVHLQPEIAAQLAKALRLYNTLRRGKDWLIDQGWEELAIDLERTVPAKGSRR